jgi:hypothetical protein
MLRRKICVLGHGVTLGQGIWIRARPGRIQQFGVIPDGRQADPGSRKHRGADP